jgi:hypothetical protein
MTNQDEELRFEYRSQAGSKVLHIFDVAYGVRAERPICNLKIEHPLTFPVDAPEDIEARGICQACLKRKSQSR